jgi:hypothetical protein
MRGPRFGRLPNHYAVYHASAQTGIDCHGRAAKQETSGLLGPLARTFECKRTAQILVGQAQFKNHHLRTATEHFTAQHVGTSFCDRFGEPFELLPNPGQPLAMAAWQPNL